MARRRKPCEFCDGESINSNYIEHRNGYCLWYEFYPFNNGLFSVIAQANDEEGELIEDAVDLNFAYCPMCGRKLEEG